MTDLRLRPIGKQRLSDQVARSIREYILERRLQPGDAIPSERDLSAALAVSRHVVREAIRMLEDGGILTVGQGKDTIVQQLPDRLDAAESVEIPLASREYAQEAQSIFEAGLAECLVERATADDLARLHVIVDEMRRRVQLGHPGNEDDLAFHAQLHRCTRNPYLVQIGRIVVLPGLRNRLIHIPVTSLLDEPELVHPEDHETIVELIEAHDIDGLRRHLRQHPYGPMRADAGA